MYFDKAEQNVKKNALRLSMSLALLVTCTGAQNTRKLGSTVAERSHFSAESETVDRPATVTESVLQVLRTDADVGNVLKAESLSFDQLPSSWFSASEIFGWPF